MDFGLFVSELVSKSIYLCLVLIYLLIALSHLILIFLVFGQSFLQLLSQLTQDLISGLVHTLDCIIILLRNFLNYFLFCLEHVLILSFIGNFFLLEVIYRCFECLKLLSRGGMYLGLQFFYFLLFLEELFDQIARIAIDTWLFWSGSMKLCCFSVHGLYWRFQIINCSLVIFTILL